MKLLDFSGTDGEFEVSEEEINIGISLQKGNDELKDAINGVLGEMSEGRLLRDDGRGNLHPASG